MATCRSNLDRHSVAAAPSNNTLQPRPCLRFAPARPRLNVGVGPEDGLASYITNMLSYENALEYLVPHQSG